MKVFRILGLCACLGACGGDGPTTPSGANYAGEWAGTTFQGQPFSFSVSSSHKVTRITVGYTFSGCSGVETFSNLDLDIFSPPPYFAHGASLPDGRSVSVQAYFITTTVAQGVVTFYGSQSCGSTGSGGPASASKR